MVRNGISSVILQCNFNMIAKTGQTLFDIALQEYGTLEAANTIAAANNIALTDSIEGIDLLLPDFDVDSAAATVKRRIETYSISTDIDAQQIEGIGFWAIQQNFRVWQGQ